MVGIKIHNGKAVLYRSIDNKILPVESTLNKIPGYYVHSDRESMEDYWHNVWLMKTEDDPKDYFTKGIHLYEDAQTDSLPHEGDLSHILPEDSEIWNEEVPDWFKQYYL